MANYVCAELSTSMMGNTVCQTWVELAEPTPLIPEISKADADAITVSIVTILVIAWGWRQLRSLIK